MNLRNRRVVLKVCIFLQLVHTLSWGTIQSEENLAYQKTVLLGHWLVKFVRINILN